MAKPLIAEPVRLNSQHNLSKFDCGNHRLTYWLKRHALTNQNASSTYTFVIEESAFVVGYYAFSIGSVAYIEAPGRVQAGMPARFEIPIFLLARLAVSQSHQRQKLGQRLLRHAIKRAIEITKLAPLKAIVLDALDEDAKSFYSKFDFQTWPVDQLRMWLPIQDVLAADE